MSQRIALLVGTRKGLFVLDGDTSRDTGRCAARCARAGRSTTRSSTRVGRAPRGRRQHWYGPAVWRSDDLGETWSHSSEGLTYGDDGPKVADGLERHRRPGRALRRRRAGGAVPEPRRRRDLGARRGPDRTTRPRPEWQPGNGGLILHSIVPHPTDADRMWVGISAVGAFETQRRRRDLGDAQQGRPRRLRPETPTPSSASASTSWSWPPTAASTSTSRTTAASTARPTAAPVGGDHRGLPREFGFPMAAHPRDPQTVWTIPLTRARRGPAHARGPRRGLADQRRRRHLDPQRRRAAAARTPIVGVLREAMAVDRLDPVGVYFGTSTGQLYGSRDEGRSVAPDRRQPAADLVGRGRGRRLTPADPRGRRPPAALARRAVPGRAAPRRGARRDGRGRDRRPRRPGARASATGCSTPARCIRTHINVFVERRAGDAVDAGPARRGGPRHPGRLGRLSDRFRSEGGSMEERFVPPAPAEAPPRSGRSPQVTGRRRRVRRPSTIRAPCRSSRPSTGAC